MSLQATVSTVGTQAAPALTLDNVLYEKRDGIAYVTINRPKVLNALNTPTWKDLRTAFENARDDVAVRGVLLTGAGNKAFVAGADISELAHVAAFEAEQSSRFGQEVLDVIENLGKPVVAAVNGFALGGGCETAMACTIRIAADSAKFGQPEVTLGLVPGGGGTQRLPRLVGKGRALQLILSGETISAQKAYRIGLVNESGGFRELHRGSQRRGHPFRFRRRRHQSGASERRPLETWASDPSAAAGEGSLSLASGQSQQTRHDARFEIAERGASRRKARQM